MIGVIEGFKGDRNMSFLLTFELIHSLKSLKWDKWQYKTRREKKIKGSKVSFVAACHALLAPLPAFAPFEALRPPCESYEASEVKPQLSVKSCCKRERWGLILLVWVWRRRMPVFGNNKINETGSRLSHGSIVMWLQFRRNQENSNRNENKRQLNIFVSCSNSTLWQVL